jgi:serine/threonine-protein kinase
MAATSAPRFQEVIEGYWVGDKIGVGARSEIYEVKRKSDGRLFAAKFVPVRGDEDLRRIGHLENEYNVLREIHAEAHVGIGVCVRVEEFKKIKRFFRIKAAYLVMERLTGAPLARDRDYELDDVLTVFRQVCLGLERTHNAGYVHADLKPDNILVGENLDVKLIDFGFAARIGTTLSSAKGTFGYLAPEQAGGRLTPKTDVFNLGAALYWTLTGQNVPSIMPGEHEAAGFVPGQQISLKPPYLLNPDVPRELSDMVLRCCAAKQHERPTVTELKRYLHGLQLRIDYGAA